VFEKFRNNAPERQGRKSKNTLIIMGNVIFFPVMLYNAVRDKINIRVD